MASTRVLYNSFVYAPPHILNYNLYSCIRNVGARVLNDIVRWLHCASIPFARTPVTLLTLTQGATASVVDVGRHTPRVISGPPLTANGGPLHTQHNTRNPPPQHTQIPPHCQAHSYVAAPRTYRGCIAVKAIVDDVSGCAAGIRRLWRPAVAVSRVGASTRGKVRRQQVLVIRCRAVVVVDIECLQRAPKSSAAANCRRKITPVIQEPREICSHSSPITKTETHVRKQYTTSYPPLNHHE